MQAAFRRRRLAVCVFPHSSSLSAGLAFQRQGPSAKIRGKKSPLSVAALKHLRVEPPKKWRPRLPCTCPDKASARFYRVLEDQLEVLRKRLTRGTFQNCRQDQDDHIGQFATILGDQRHVVEQVLGNGSNAGNDHSKWQFGECSELPIARPAAGSEPFVNLRQAFLCGV
jgi:hypothetical protein